MKKKESIRAKYEEFGVDEYYSSHAGAYLNPHVEQVSELVQMALKEFKITSALDFCAGSGEVFRVLKEHKLKPLLASDPFTWKLFERKNKAKCLPLSFDDVIKGKLSSYQFDAVFCSFAMHLCPEKQLYTLTSNLLQVAPLLFIITPHKRPQLEVYPDFLLAWEEFALTDKGKKVRIKLYKSNIHADV